MFLESEFVFQTWNRYWPSPVYGCDQGNKPFAVNVVLGIPTRPASTTKRLMRRPAENVVVWRLYRLHILGDGVSDKQDNLDVNTGADICGLSGTDGHWVGTDRAVSQGAWEELPECQLIAIPNQGRGNIPGLCECIVVSVRVLTGAVMRQ